jgi:diguanylate cyclase (GGDEF)-like protein/PAS domain S-box-containing protein
VAFFNINTSARLALFVALIVSGNLWLGVILKILPSAHDPVSEARTRSGYTLSEQIAELIERNELKKIEEVLGEFLKTNQDLTSIGVTYPNLQQYRLMVGPHQKDWVVGSMAANQMSFPLDYKTRPLGFLEFCYKPVGKLTLLQRLFIYPTAYIAFATSLTCLLVWLTLNQKFRYLDPVKVVAGQVRTAFDSLTEGLVVIDRKKNIVHANQAFGHMVGHLPDELVGGSLETFVWTPTSNDEQMPWDRAFESNTRVSGKLIQLITEDRASKYNVNANPITDEKGIGQAVIVSFDDVTVLEQKKQDLAKTVESLQESRDEITKQNHHLRFLASRDPLTKCFNRRSFWEIFEKSWQECPKHLLNIVIIDVDHFKSINDNFGHSKGDEVLREVGAMLLELIGPHGTVCRFGGEEMAVLLPNMEFETAVAVAEAIFDAFQRCSLGGLKITASIGISNRTLGAMDTQHLLDQADQCLYAAKRNGRNQVVRFDQIANKSEKELLHSACQNEDMWQSNIRYSTATALHSALSHRNPAAASHSARLADLCVAVGKKLLDPRSLYLVEVAALTHELGWLGRGVEEFCATTMQTPEVYRELKQTSCNIVDSSFGNKLISWVICEPDQEADDYQKLAELTRAGLTKARQMLSMCDEFLHVYESSGARRISAAVVLAVWIKDHPEFASAVARAIDEWIQSSQPFAFANAQEIDQLDSDASMALSAHIHELYRALSKKDLTRLRRVVGRIHEEASQFSCSITSDAVEKLRDAVEKRGVEMDDLATLSDRLLDLCRMTRNRSMEEEYAPQKHL